MDLVFVPGWVSHIEYAWEEPSFAPFLERMASFSRLILLDRFERRAVSKVAMRKILGMILDTDVRQVRGGGRQDERYSRSCRCPRLRKSGPE